MKTFIARLLGIQLLTRKEWDKLVDDTNSVAAMRKVLELRGIVK